jgi:hypothetical protein
MNDFIGARTNVPQWRRTFAGDWAWIVRNLRPHVSRKYLFWRHLASSPWAKTLSFSTGVVKLENFAIPGTREVVDHCRALFQRRVAERSRPPDDGKPYRQTIAGTEDLVREEPILAFVLSTPVLAIAAGYLHQLPLLQAIKLWRSSPCARVEGSQLFHQDSIDRRQAKFFLFLDDVTSVDGPVTVLPAPVSDRLRAATGYEGGRLRDDVVFRHVDPACQVVLTGKAGDLALVDTSRCFHYGSRDVSGERRMLMFHFTTHRAGKKHSGDGPSEQYRKDPLRRWVMSAAP